MTSASADWFGLALKARPDRHDLDVDGTRVRVRTWGRPDSPGLVLVHGGAANSAWWDHIAPLLATDRFVVALDLSGHGDSEWREGYTLQNWVDEVAAAATLASGPAGPPAIVGHSMGGRIATTLAAHRADLVSLLITVDSPLGDRPLSEENISRRRRPTRVYPSSAEATSRWVTLPAQPNNVPYVEQHLAVASVRAVQRGWTWKFDPQFFGRASHLGDAEERVQCPYVLLRSEHGIVGRRMLADARARIGDHLQVIEMPGVGHHPMLDQPLMLISVLRTVLTLVDRTASEHTQPA